MVPGLKFLALTLEIFVWVWFQLHEMLPLLEESVRQGNYTCSALTLFSLIIILFPELACHHFYVHVAFFRLVGRGRIMLGLVSTGILLVRLILV
jgi:hypothetical protein